MKRFPFLDWMRGLAVVVMIQCHVFNSFARMDVRDGGPYVLSQFLGGMAAPLFLFMAGMTLAFLMDSLERREPDARRRWLRSLRRAGYILGIAFAFRISNWLGSLPGGSTQEITKVDILNCMAVAMGVFSIAALFRSAGRVRFAAALAIAIAVAAPLMAHLPWEGVPSLLREYLVPIPGRGRFPFFPCAAYLGFGLATGAIVKQAAAERLERVMQWALLIGLGAAFTSQYFSNLPYSIYPHSDFWTDSPALIFIRTGITLAFMAGSYLWTEYLAGTGWSWMECLGKSSLMVYWVHVVLVYGNLARPIKRSMTIPQTALATMAVIGLMVGLVSAAGYLTLRFKPRAPALPAQHPNPVTSLAAR